MTRSLRALALVSLCLCHAAGAAGEQARELEPVHVSAIRDPELRRYEAILAGLDAFDRHRRLAPAVEQLRFTIEPRHSDTPPAAPTARLTGKHGFTLPLPLDATGRFVVPRSEAALDTDSELELNQKRSLYRIAAEVRTPGLPANQRRMGDLRLECQVKVAIMKAEMPWYWATVLTGVFLSSDWCSFFDDKKKATFSYRAGKPITAAVLREGERVLPLRVDRGSFEVSIASPAWSDEAMVELNYADPTEPSTGTAGETPRTAP